MVSPHFFFRRPAALLVSALLMRFVQITVAYFLYQELFAADSKTRQFNHAVDRVKADSRCTDLLGPASEITAFGEPTSNKWARARPLAHSVEVDRFGTTHFVMRFHAEGPKGAGVVHVHMTKAKADQQPKYKYLSLNVKGHPTVYLENADAKSPKKAVAKVFGVKWA
jgi:mitochondrial import inner membrane translocase subunit TIM21